MSVGSAFQPYVKRSSSFGKLKTEVEQAEDPNCKPKYSPIPWPENLTKIVTGIGTGCHKDTGKLWLVQNCLVWDDKAHCWEEECEGICELTQAYKASVEGEDPVILPDFNGVFNVHTADGVVDVYGGDPTPVGMIGTILCVNGELCYFGDAPLPEIPEEVQIGGPAPELDSGVEIWVDNGVVKHPTDAGWAQVTPFGS